MRVGVRLGATPARHSKQRQTGIGMKADCGGSPAATDIEQIFEQSSETKKALCNICYIEPGVV